MFKEHVGYVIPGKEYTWVELGPRPDMPPWHAQAQPARYPFPDHDAALKFARAESETSPGRDVVIAYPDGRRWDGKAWVA
ncbi:hypothetical protein H7I96_03280 [Mycolicibacterium aichiense]|nr:hypothetical protein [Mycolicibacterium aichiense]